LNIKLIFLLIFFIVLNLAQPDWSTQDLADPGLKLGPVEEKIGKVMIWLTRQNPVKKPVATR
jgi:hypothetical protein